MTKDKDSSSAKPARATNTSTGGSARPRSNSASVYGSGSASPSASAMRGSSSNSDSPCGSCKLSVNAKTNGIECEICLKWFHINCAGLSSDTMKLLTKPGIHWFCDDCDKLQLKIGYQVIKLESKIDELKKMVASLELDTKMSSINETYADIVKRVEKQSDEIKESSEKLQSSQNKTAEFLAEHDKLERERKMKDEREFREKNVIIFGIEETDKKEMWMEKLQNLLNEAHIKPFAPNTEIYRLGKRDSEKTKSARPIRICTDSVSVKWDVLKRINKFQKDINGKVFARLDLNEKEREQDFLLRKELRETRLANPGKTFKIMRKKVIQVNE